MIYFFFFIDENSNEAADPEMINKLFDWKIF